MRLVVRCLLFEFEVSVLNKCIDSVEYIIDDNCNRNRSVDAVLLLFLLGFYNRRLRLAMRDIQEDADDVIKLVMDIEARMKHNDLVAKFLKLTSLKQVSCPGNHRAWRING